MLTLFLLVTVLIVLIFWVQQTSIGALRKDLTNLTQRFNLLISQIEKKGGKKKGEQKEEPTPQPSQTKSGYDWEALQARASQINKGEIIETKPTVKQERVSILKKINFEQAFAQSLPVWIGGIALAFAGLFLVKYSIETGLLSPSVRLVLGGIFGAGLVFIGNWIEEKGNIPNGRRISQALSGAGISVLYICLFAATSLYHLITNEIGFLGMGAVTAIAVVLSLKQGPAIALLGMVGGFLTPALIGSKEPNAPLLFIYLYMVFAGLFIVIRKNNWWHLALPAVFAAFLWVIVWLHFYFVSSDGLWLGLFILAISLSSIIASKQALETGELDRSQWIKLSKPFNYVTLGGSVILMSVVAAKSEFGEVEWSLFAILSAGGMVLSYYNQKIYGFVPWISMVMNAILIMVWHEGNPTYLSSMIVGFGVLFSGSSYWLMWRSSRPFSWGLFSAISSLIYYFIAYAKFHNWDRYHYFTPSEGDYHLWALLAFGLFIISVVVLVQILNRFNESPEEKQKLLTVFTLAATAFLSTSLTLELEQEFLRIALASEILAICWINNYVRINILRFLASLLAGVFLVLIFEIVLRKLSLHISIEWSLIQLGIPGIIFLLSSFLLRKQDDDIVVGAFELIGISLFTLMAYYINHNLFNYGEDLTLVSSTFIERGVLTNIYFLMGLTCLQICKWYERRYISFAGIGLLGIAFLRIILFDIFVFNPLWSHQYVGNYPLFNYLLFPFAFPAIWLILAKDDLIRLKNEYVDMASQIILLVFIFCFTSLSVRQFFHHPYLDDQYTSSAEIYSYSVAWLLTGIAILIYGTWTHNKIMRSGSLIFMVLTIGKVFLYDASELTGLYRVFSFLGLGLSLIALSWFYARFVFKQMK
jgi:uncharacterized membrane protein